MRPAMNLSLVPDEWKEPEHFELVVDGGTDLNLWFDEDAHLVFKATSCTGGVKLSWGEHRFWQFITKGVQLLFERHLEQMHTQQCLITELRERLLEELDRVKEKERLLAIEKKKVRYLQKHIEREEKTMPAGIELIMEGIRARIRKDHPNLLGYEQIARGWGAR